MPSGTTTYLDVLADEPTFHPSAQGLHKQSSLYLDFTASDIVAFGEQCIILGDKEKEARLVKIKVKQKLAQKWVKDLPGSISFSSNRCVRHTSLVCQNRRGEPVETLSTKDLSHQSTYPGLAGHRLCAVLPGRRILYANKTSSSSYSAEIYSLLEHQHIATLAPPTPYQSYYISACCHPHSHHLAVVDDVARFLDIYDDQHVHQARVNLPYRPLWENAVCTVNEYIVIADERNLRLYSWVGEKVRKQTHHDLGVARIRGVGRSADGRVMLAAGMQAVNSLHLYHAKC